MNDTHPAVAVLELLRFFLDEEGMAWEEAWILVRNSCLHNHTLLPEHWKLGEKNYLGKFYPGTCNSFRKLIAVFRKKFVRFPGDEEQVRRMSIVADGQVRMAYLSVVASRSVNGVAAFIPIAQTRLMSDC